MTSRKKANQPTHLTRRKLLLFYHCSGCYCFSARGIVFVVCSIVLKGKQAIHVRPYESCNMTLSKCYSRYSREEDPKLQEYS